MNKSRCLHTPFGDQRLIKYSPSLSHGLVQPAGALASDAQTGRDGITESPGALHVSRSHVIFVVTGEREHITINKTGNSGCAFYI
jgi:hypothetical protein